MTTPARRLARYPWQLQPKLRITLTVVLIGVITVTALGVLLYERSAGSTLSDFPSARATSAALAAIQADLPHLSTLLLGAGRGIHLAARADLNAGAVLISETIESTQPDTATLAGGAEDDLLVLNTAIWTHAAMRPQGYLRVTIDYRPTTSPPTGGIQPQTVAWTVENAPVGGGVHWNELSGPSAWHVYSQAWGAPDLGPWGPPTFWP